MRGAECRQRRIVIVTARVHPGETPASHLVHGMMAFLAGGGGAEAAALRRAITWVFVPMLNPDGVVAGNYRCDAGALPYDRYTFRTQCFSALI